MAIAARYGHIQPSVFEEMDFEEAQLVAQRCHEMAQQEIQLTAEMHTELTKAEIKALSETVQSLARSMAG